VRVLGDSGDVQNVFADFDVSGKIMAALDERGRRFGRVSHFCDTLIA
jgi:hypothetical protein